MPDLVTIPRATEAVVRRLSACFAIAAVALATICLRAASVLPDKPFTEDGFYLLSAARNLALGNGVTIDGERLTNGIQPLFAFLAAPAYWLFDGDRLEGLRGVLLLHSLSFVGAAWLFGLVLRDALRGSERLRWIGSLSWLASGYLFVLSHNGLETGCLLFAYLAYWRLWQRWPLAGMRAAAVHGAALGALVLTRIDATFFVAALLALHGVHGDRRLGERVKEACVAGVVALAVSSPWWIFNLVEFGALMPSSGTAQSEIPGDHGGELTSRIVAAAKNVLLVATPMLFGGDGAGGARFLAVRAVFLVGVIVVLWRVPRLPRSATVARDPGRAVAVALLGAGAALVVYYVWRFWATHFYNRYFVLLAPFGMAMWSVAAERMVAAAPWAGRFVASGLAAAAVGLAVICHTGVGFAGNEWLREQLAVVRQHVPPGARLAAGQSGTLGYFVDGVHNLDGKVNVEALRHQRDMPRYLVKHRIEWLCDWPSYLHRYVGPSGLQAEWQLVAVPDVPRTDAHNTFQLWRRRCVSSPGR